jgi:2-oxoglutarate dehydrogenase E2 component (dihydrolipoamide succinyltransferase)
MAQVEMIMPKMGESVAEATIIKWAKKEGDRIEADETVLEIATDKVDSEVPSPAAGILIKRFFQEGDVVQVGKIIALIGSEMPSADIAPVETPSSQEAATLAEAHVAVAAQTASNDIIERISASGKFYSPLVRSIAQQEGISMAELDALAGTGKDGRVTKNDILAYLPNRKNTPTTVSSTPVSTPIVVEAPKAAPVAEPAKAAPSIQAPALDGLRVAGLVILAGQVITLGLFPGIISGISDAAVRILMIAY